MPYKDAEQAKAYQREYQKKWRQKNPERAKKRGTDSYARNSEIFKERARASYSANREEQVARVVTGNKKRRRVLRLRAIEHYGGHCACCGEKRFQFLAIDHIDGNGSQHRREQVKNQTIALWLYKNNYPDGFRVLCHNCNCARGYYGYCPHQVEKGEITEEQAILLEVSRHAKTAV